MAIGRRIGAWIGFWRARGPDFVLDITRITAVLSLTTENSVLTFNRVQTTVRSLTSRFTVQGLS